MKKIINIMIGTVITVLIGGAAYNINKVDLVNNFSQETGLTKNQAEKYIDNISKDEMIAWSELGRELKNECQEIVKIASALDCDNEIYFWETSSFDCWEGKKQLNYFSQKCIDLGNSYIKLDSENATKQDVNIVIKFIDDFIECYDLEIIHTLLDSVTAEEILKTHLYNKSILKTVVESGELD